MNESDFPEHVKLCKFIINFHFPCNTKDSLNDINGGVALIGKEHNLSEGVINILLNTERKKLGCNLGMRLITDLIQIVGVDITKAIKRALDIVEGNPHITIGSKDGGINTRLIILDSLFLKDKSDAGRDVLIRQPSKADDSTSTLNRFNNLGGQITSQSKPSGIGMQLHSPPQGLLCSRGHRIGLIQENNLMPARREGDLFLGKHLNSGTDGIDTAVVRSVELEDGVAQLGAQGLAGQGHDGGGLSAARGPGEEEIGHVAVDSDDAQTVEDVRVADYVV